MPAIHDSDYKLFFSHPEMVRDLLRDWVSGEWIKEADCSRIDGCRMGRAGQGRAG
jgi:hypothetical protein